MEANKNSSCYEEALAYIAELKCIIRNLYAVNEIDEKIIAKYEELVAIYKKELAEQ